ncbi:Uncharacterised protein [Enterobacter ludwigii]|nr:Uncharacterised protein [Enterobacter ludwigii]
MSKMAVSWRNNSRSPIFTKPSSMLGFLFWQHSRPVATERYGEVCEVWLLDIECFQKGRAIKAGYVYPASFDRLPEVAGMVVVLFVSIPFVAMVGRNPTI